MGPGEGGSGEAGQGVDKAQDRMGETGDGKAHKGQWVWLEQVKEKFSGSQWKEKISRQRHDEKVIDKSLRIDCPEDRGNKGGSQKRHDRSRPQWGEAPGLIQNV